VRITKTKSTDFLTQHLSVACYLPINWTPSVPDPGSTKL